MVLDKAGLLKKGKLKVEEVEIDGDSAIITEVTAAEYMDVYNSESAKDAKGEYDGSKFVAVLATRCIVDKKGARLFTDADADLLRGMSSTVYTKLILKVKKLNGMGDGGKN